MKNNFSNEYDDRYKWQRENPELHEGNMFFGHRYSTWSLERMLENAIREHGDEIALSAFNCFS